MKKYSDIKIPTKGKLFDGFIKQATQIVDTDCKHFDGSKIIGVERDNLIQVMAMDLLTGSESTKNSYILFGVACGAVLASATFLTYNKFKKSREVES